MERRAQAAPTGFEARLLGPLEVVDHGERLALGPAGQRALLARLLLEANRPISVERLVEDLWAGDVPPTAVKMIHVHVSKLRKRLPAGMLVTDSPGYAVHVPTDGLDLARFERLAQRGSAALARGSIDEAADRLRQALSLWRGPALAEFDQPFATIESRRLDELRLACLEDRIEADLALGAHARIVGELDALLARHPLRERLWHQLMLALYRSGRQADALASYQRVRLTLSTELGIAPSPALRELERRILRQDATLTIAPPHRRPVATTPSAAIGEGATKHGGRKQRRTARRSRRGACSTST
jgi:DNA-binding SARP family transcriptional activator